MFTLLHPWALLLLPLAILPCFFRTKTFILSWRGRLHAKLYAALFHKTQSTNLFSMWRILALSLVAASAVLGLASPAIRHTALVKIPTPNIEILLDITDSMSPFGLVKSRLHDLLTGASSTHRFGLVAFDSQAYRLFSPGDGIVLRDLYLPYLTPDIAPHRDEAPRVNAAISLTLKRLKKSSAPFNLWLITSHFGEVEARELATLLSQIHRPTNLLIETLDTTPPSESTKKTLSPFTWHMKPFSTPLDLPDFQEFFGKGGGKTALHTEYLHIGFWCFLPLILYLSFQLSYRLSWLLWLPFLLFQPSSVYAKDDIDLSLLEKSYQRQELSVVQNTLKNALMTSNPPSAPARVAMLRYNLGNTLLLQGHSTEALSAYQQAKQALINVPLSPDLERLYRYIQQNESLANRLIPPPKPKKDESNKSPKSEKTPSRPRLFGDMGDLLRAQMRGEVMDLPPDCGGAEC